MSLRQVCIAVRFPAERYHGAEWPASAARFFQALVNGVMTGANRRLADEVEPALRWLEKQPAPAIRAMAAESGAEYRIAVPNNDFDVVAKEWALGRQSDPARLKTMKTVLPKLLAGDGPHLQYIWRLGDHDPDPPLNALRKAVRCLHTLGWGVDMAYADVTDEVPHGDLWEPSSQGRRLASPMEGTLDDLHATYARFTRRASSAGVDADTRPSMFRMQPYRVRGAGGGRTAMFSLLQAGASSRKWRSVSWKNCMKVAGWLRHAAGAAVRQEGTYDEAWIQSYVEGHAAEGAESHRISYLPLPSLHQAFGDGMIRRVMIAEPPGSDGSTIRLLELKLAGMVLLDRSGEPACCLGPADRDWSYEQYLPREPMHLWRSVTPVVLHGFNTGRRRQISVQKTERLLLRAFEMAGFEASQIEALAFQGGPLVQGTQHAMAMVVPDHLRQYPRVHVQVRFQKGVSGPVTAGIGRHYGIGLFTSVRDK